MWRAPEYAICRFRGHFRIIRRKWDGVTSIGIAVGDYDDFEEARKEMYRLNGWKYKPKNTQ